jgi:uncharacterized lipoprotein YddW (UPF0748 family)
MRRLFVLLLLLVMLPVVPTRAAPSHEFRGLWVDAFNSGIKNPAQVNQLVADAERAHVNALIVQVRRRGDAYYVSGVEPRTNDSALAPAPYDPLRTLLDAAHKRGIEVHAWVATLSLWRTTMGQPPEGHILHSHGVGADDDWVSRDDAGRTSTSENDILLDPGVPGVAEYTADVTSDMLRRYPDLDGLHLDRVRYNAMNWGYNPTAVARFQAKTGRSDVPVPGDSQWSDWRRAQVTELVQLVSDQAHAISPHVRVSVAAIAFGDGPQAVGGWEKSAPYKQVFQDWSGWLKSGIIDTAVVMNYDNQDIVTHQRYYNNWVDWETSQAGGEVVVGPASYLNCVDGTLAQIGRAQQRGALGASLYSYAGPTRADCKQTRTQLLDALANGPFAERVPAPLVRRKDRGGLEGVLRGEGVPTAGAGVRISLGGPETRTLVTDQYGYFKAAGLRPGEYNAAVALSGDRVLIAQVTVAVNAVAEVGGWQQKQLTEKTFLPLINQ